MIGFLILTAFYTVVFIWIENDAQVAGDFMALLDFLPAAFLLAFLSFLIRYFRWHWLISRAGYHLKFTSGLLAYFAGFAYTATPGKAGELVRCRYFARLGIPSSTTVSAFLFERMADLLVVLILAGIAFIEHQYFMYAVVFVTAVVGLIALAILKNDLVGKVNTAACFSRFVRFRHAAVFVRDALRGCKIWLTAADLTVCMLSGLLGWTIICFAFMVILNGLAVIVPLSLALSVYPLALLTGAASMMPGGIGATEVVIVTLLMSADVSLQSASLAALGIRIATLWFAMVCGFISVFLLEFLARSK